MRLLADENLPAVSIRQLRDAGHDVLAVREAMPGATDAAVLERAIAESRVLVTCDRDFGMLAARQVHPVPVGIVLLRLIPVTPEEVGTIVREVLGDPSLELGGRLTVVEPDRVRQRPLPIRRRGG